VVPGGGTGVAFGDGLRCASGNVVRLDIVASPSGTAQCPASGAASIAARSGAPPGGVRVYQAWYRDAATFCTSATFNLTNGLAVQWTP
jgi:hypothetical protein